MNRRALIKSIIIVAIFICAIVMLYVSNAGRSPLDRAGASRFEPVHGMTLDEVSADLGDPETIESYTLARPLDELRSIVYETYRPDDPATAAVKVREARWRDGDHALAVWFHEVEGAWIAFESCRWHKDVAFE